MQLEDSDHEAKPQSLLFTYGTMADWLRWWLGENRQSGRSPGPLPAQVLQGRLKVGDLPVSHTEVQLRLNGQVLTSASSDELGSFQFDLQTPDLSKQVLGRGTQVADVVAIIDGPHYSSILQDGPEFVWVTELTTLVHDYMEDHPQATFEEADAAVGRSLGCPAGEAVEKLSDRDIFDPATFQQQADVHGGDQAFFDLGGSRPRHSVL